MNRYEKVIIYYFTGTGNARNVAGWVKNVASDKKMDCRIVNIFESNAKYEGIIGEEILSRIKRNPQYTSN